MDNAGRIILQKFADALADEVELTPSVYKAFTEIERELFVPQGFRHWAYRLDALPIKANQWISSPITVAKMTVYLEPDGADNVLEIGCGSGYQAAILSRLFRRVFTIERIDALLKEAKTRFKKLDIHNIHTRLDDGQRGWRQYAPFDRILFSASTPQVPQTLFDQLADKGVLVAPIEKDGEQIITQFKKENGVIKEFPKESCLFVPVKKGVE
ncbi:protein-L-isoaspartate(D-aspartate) O-methyltransferase [Hydrogenimonas cancrithermarum]|uniref:Protein-L-isoaspartate O-methyltransferase n=1 Tax=Hydrogenimonas cancrithermarum TaxID=2993563 RepID=A0ABM8FLF2_9BACT|nr:protein-L-isoaspartate(D-aspartate) O-methyltransferase [Hydrogenimonas cancrithermarum]BDY13127.1 protein-L-isoaspartate O-methyltransferase [Hydrogenimonas cancrithermarum]